MFSFFSDLEQLGKDLCDAAERGDVEAIERLLLLGVSADVRGGLLNTTPLHIVAHRNSVQVAQVLLEHDPDIKARDEDNRTPLHFAARNNSTEVAQLLL